ncbi:MAG: L-lysine 6-transaminase [Ignavibacteria bacterium]|nr:L-lysine 6-transaminase [Ignavibacteria bacterium]
MTTRTTEQGREQKNHLPRHLSTSEPSNPPFIPRQPISPSDVHATLKKHMLVDGFEFVVDFKRSHGSYLFDFVSNRRLLDFFTFFASGSVGFNHPKLTDPAFKEHLATLAVNKPSNSDVYSVELAEFVSTFSRIALPSYMKYMFFIEGGAVAVENALKTAFDWKIRKNFERGYKEERGNQIVHFRRAFHGRSGYALSLTNTDPTKTNYFPKFSWPRIHNPAIRFPLNEENLRRVEEEERQALAQIKDAIKSNPDDIAGLIIEPIQAEGGDNHFRKEFFIELRQICNENEILLIFDEVQTGVGLTGRMWAHEYFVEPDLMAFGKKTQVCGVLSGTRIDDIQDNVFHKPSRINSTFGGNLIDMVRFMRILEIIEEDHLIGNAERVGTHLLAQLSALQSEFPKLIDNVRGRGLFCAMDLPTPELRLALRKKALSKGLILIGCGESAIRFRPPLNLSADEADEGLAIIRQSLKELSTSN